jgi:transposase
MAPVVAATLVAELGDITRFANRRQLMAYLGLVPSEHSSGGTRRRGSGAARRMLIEAAWSYRFPARISREQLLRQEGLAKPIRDTAWKAQERLSDGIASWRGRQATDRRYRRDRPRVGGLRLGKRQCSPPTRTCEA